jgi:hypothetical protein
MLTWWGAPEGSRSSLDEGKDGGMEGDDTLVVEPDQGNGELRDATAFEIFASLLTGVG